MQENRKRVLTLAVEKEEQGPIASEIITWIPIATWVVSTELME
jgi:hypothetical protein